MAATIRNGFDPGFGVYVHWPFCLSKCPYCDFNSHVRRGDVDEDRFVEAFCAEIAHRAALAPNRTVNSVFFGGGTPSLMAPSTVAAILDGVAKHWSLAQDVEISLEANPTSVEAASFRGFKAAGINRVSLGIQALNDLELKNLGRATFGRGGAGRPERGQFGVFPHLLRSHLRSPRPNAGELAQGARHRAFLREGTHFLIPTDDRAGHDVRTHVRRRQTGRAGHGYAAGPVGCDAGSNRPRRNARLRSFKPCSARRRMSAQPRVLAIWRYAGVGPGAHGRLNTPRGRRAQSTERHPEMWLTCVETEGHGLVEDELLNAEQQGDEFLLMGLRLREGIDPQRYLLLTGKKLAQSRITELVGDGLVEFTRDNRLRVSSEGFPVLDAVVADLAA